MTSFEFSNYVMQTLEREKLFSLFEGLPKSINGPVAPGAACSRDEATHKMPFERALIRNPRMLNRHLWELRGEVSMACEQITLERSEAAMAKGEG